MTPTTLDAVLLGQVRTFGPHRERSAIRKERVRTPVEVNTHGLSGDQHAYHAHGGPEKALLHYAAEHYATWRQRFPDMALHRDALGENLVTEGMTEESVCVGDRFRIGPEVVVEVSQPRQPCYKLGFNTGVTELPLVMQEEGATGWFYRVVTTGTVQAGMDVELVARPYPEWTLKRLIDGFYGTPLDREFLHALTELPVLGAEWRAAAQQRLDVGKVEEWKERLYGHAR